MASKRCLSIQGSEFPHATPAKVDCVLTPTRKKFCDAATPVRVLTPIWRGATGKKFDSLADANPARVAEVEGVLTALTPLRPGASGKSYFDGTLADESASLRIVGFTEEQQGKMAEYYRNNTTITLENCKIEKVRNGDEMQVVVTPATSINQSQKKINPVRPSWSSGDITLEKLQDLPEHKVVCVLSAEVAEVGKARTVHSGSAVQEVKISDETGSGILALWDADIGKLEEGKSYKLDNLRVKYYNKSNRLIPVKSAFFFNEISEQSQLAGSQAGTASRACEHEAASESEFVESIKQAVFNGEKTERKLAHCVLVGPTGSGKSSLLDRLVIRLKRRALVSTGISDAVVMVNTFHSVTVLDSSSNLWREQEHDVSLMHHMKAKPEAVVDLKEGNSSRAILSNVSNNTKMTAANQVFQVDPPYIVKQDIQKLVISTMIKIGGFRKFKHFLQEGYSLYFRDTGGQVEFQEIVSLLVFGPSIFLFVFRLDRDFKSKFAVEFRESFGKSLNCYTSSITTEEALLQCLASVYVMDSTRTDAIKTHQPLVFVVGTHKDQLGSSAEKQIADLNQQLDSSIIQNGFDGLVQYADRTKGQVMFTVDNTADNDKDFELIRSEIHNLIVGRPEFTVDYPISYLLFCLELQNDQRSILTLDECKLIAAKYSIVGDQVFHLLKFLHLRIGIIQHYDIEGVRHIIVNEPQVFFNKVTDLVVRTFSCKALTSKEANEFEKKGILTASAFESIVSGEDLITAEQFIKILVHLRIITPFKTQGDKQDKYFIPCVLNHVSESTEEALQTDIKPLSVGFQCKHCPKGLFGVLVTHLMAPNESDHNCSSITFALIQDKIFKDQVSFEIHSWCEQDEISLKVLPSHIEINFYPELSEDRDMPVDSVCNEVRQRIQTALSNSIQDLHYSRDTVKPVMCFKCDVCLELHPVKEGKKNKIYCPKERKSSPIPLQARCWYKEEPPSHASNSPITPSSPKTRSLSDKDHYRVVKIFNRLTNQDLLKVGLLLGLCHLHMTRMNQENFSAEVATSWLRRDDNVKVIAPPSWESLAKALEEAGFTGIASDVKKM